MTKKITPDPPPCRTSSPTEKSDFLRNAMYSALDQINSEPPPPEPLDAFATTAFNITSDSAGKPALFAIQPGVTAKVALARVSDLLKSAELNADEIGPHLDGIDRELFRGMLQSLELSRAIVDSLLAATALPACT
ncbi:DUF6124 family protein [Pseudomonas vanderleydeniana]|uniref:Uncharacterized protein n=1 Tax=Pseudomonas vanderleydeniana TaxID=2745495 RepID=A0A9E6PGE8_9PSED|nr:hypothetical protein [Pseudomonas vanderleydeniana]QXI25998.1 hypothetical protein HU752_018735 [Pseudomonas vanderleydeniana]